MDIIEALEEMKSLSPSEEAINVVLNDRNDLIKQLDGIYADYQDLGKAYCNSVSKDKIREVLNELNIVNDNKEFGASYSDLFNFVDNIKELLEE